MPTEAKHGLEERIANALERNSDLSYRELGRAFGVDAATVYRVAKKRPRLLEIRRSRQCGARRMPADWDLAGGAPAER